MHVHASTYGILASRRALLQDILLLVIPEKWQVADALTFVH